MSQDEIHVGDKGTAFNVTLYDGTTAVDISLATSKVFVFEKPSGTKMSVTATVSGTGSLGTMTWSVPTTTTIDEDGEWRLQAKVGFSDSSYHTDITRFTVYPNLDL
jgi:hypothetical protein